MTSQTPQGLYTQGSGTQGSQVFLTVFFSRAPTSFDIGDWKVGQRWIYKSASEISGTFSAITQANPAVITAINGFDVGQIVTISGVGGMTELNGNSYTITAASGTSFTIDVDSSGFTAFTSGGIATALIDIEYILNGFTSSNGVVRANWVFLGSASGASGAGALDTLTGNNTAVVVPADASGNINLQGTSQRASAVGSTADGGGLFLTGNAGTNTLIATYESFGTNNTFLGVTAGNNTTSGTGRNIAIGNGALVNVSTGNSNIAIGFIAGQDYTTANNNIAIGTLAHTDAVATQNTTAVGHLSLTSATSGNGNTALGASTGTTLSTGANNLILGLSAGSGYSAAESSNILLMNAGTAAENNTVHLGTFGTGAGQQSTTNLHGGNVNIDSGNLSVARSSLTTVSSSVSNTSNTASADAIDFITVGGASASDPRTIWTVQGLTSWSAGIDNSDSDSWNLEPSSAPFSVPAIKVTTGGQVSFPISPLQVASGGTGQTTLTNHGVLVGASTSAITQLAVGTTGTVLTGVTGADPSFQAIASFSSIVIQTFTATGTYTPTTGMKFCVIEVVGGGGGGGGAEISGSNATIAVGGGGGGGGYARKMFSAATIGASQSVTIGAAGAAGASTPANGGTGGTTSIGALISATGGTGGVGGAATAGGFSPGGGGGAGASGSFNTTGSPGGGGIGSAITGVYSVASGGFGGSTFFGGGTLAVGGTSVTLGGNAGNSYGGGGGGGSVSGINAGAPGGAGAAGIVVVTEFI